MNEEEIGKELGYLIEECAEVIKEASKLRRYPRTTTDYLIGELADLLYMIQKLVRLGILEPKTLIRRGIAVKLPG